MWVHLEFVQPSTDNFSYQFDADLPGADLRAVALQASCEGDLARLEPFFGVTGGFGPGNRITVAVLSQPGLGGNNSGYSTGVPMEITLDFLTGPAAVHGTRSVFVAELAEILMDYRNKSTGTSTWNKGWSDWEGLSRVCAEELYAAQGADDGLNVWLSHVPRDYSWIDASDHTDQNWPSWGISILFINYLRSQLHHPLDRIIQQAGSSLAETYHNLTGGTDARSSFEQLIELFLPAGQVTTLERDNPFPFLPPHQRSVSISVSSTISEGPALTGSDGQVLGGEAFVSPGGLCPKDTYTYTLHGDSETAVITATTHGFALPRFRWTIAGILPPLPGPNDYLVTIQPTVSVGEERPDAPSHYTWASQQVRLDYDRAVAPFVAGRSNVQVVNHKGSNPGLEQFPVMVEAVDEYAYPDWNSATSSSDYISLATRSIHWDDRYQQDKQRCEEQLRDFIRRFTRFRAINIVLTLPDPPVLDIATLIGMVIYELGLVAEELPEQSTGIAEAIGKLLGIPGSQLLAGKLAIPTVERDS